jgi:hypothetical protein
MFVGKIIVISETKIRRKDVKDKKKEFHNLEKECQLLEK